MFLKKLRTYILAVTIGGSHNSHLLQALHITHILLPFLDIYND